MSAAPRRPEQRHNKASSAGSLDERWEVSFQHSLLPMLVADDDRRYVDANPAACLLLRLRRADVLRLRVDDLTPVQNISEMQTLWQQFLAVGTQAGIYELMMPDGQRVRAAYSAVANLTPGRHVSVLDVQNAKESAGGPRAQPRRELPSLTRRERDVLALVAMGETGQAIARDLSISLPTVETHVRSCLSKLGAKNRPHAVLLALKRGEISLL